MTRQFYLCRNGLRISDASRSMKTLVDYLLADMVRNGHDHGYSVIEELVEEGRIWSTMEDFIAAAKIEGGGESFPEMKDTFVIVHEKIVTLGAYAQQTNVTPTQAGEYLIAENPGAFVDPSVARSFARP